MKANFGNYIRELRKKEGFTLTQLGAKLGIDSGALSKIETGKKEMNENILPLLAETFNLNLEELKEELLSEKIANTVYNNDCNENVLILAEEKIKYLQGKKAKLENNKVNSIMGNTDIIIEDSIVAEPQLAFKYRQKELKKSKTQNKKANIKIASLFSGCGGLDLGFLGNFEFRGKKFDKTSFKIEYANDIDSAAELTYNENSAFFDNHKLHKKDIRDVESKFIPDFDFLIAGFPCQPFSNAGLRKGVNDERGNLFEECERLLKFGLKRKNKPIGFLFENVRGIMSSKMPDGTTVPDEIVKRMEALGFNTNYKLLKASNYGVPSNRYRLIIIGFRKDLGYFDFNSLDNIVGKYNLPNAKDNPYELLLGSVLSDIPKDAPQAKEYWKYSPGSQYMVDKIGSCSDGKATLKKFRLGTPLNKISSTIKQGKSWKDMRYEDMSERFQKIYDNPKKYRSPNFYRRFALGEINGTITASAQPENCGITHPFENRRFTIREIARIQSFPDNFKFPYKTIADAYKVIGNAVPPIFAWVIAKSIEQHLRNEGI